MIVPLRSYSVLVATICYAPRWRTPLEHIALLTDDLGALDVYADNCPSTERCPVSPPITERPIVVTCSS